jgi:hypothetical protein
MEQKAHCQSENKANKNRTWKKNEACNLSWLSPHRLSFGKRKIQFGCTLRKNSPFKRQQ